MLLALVLSAVFSCSHGGHFGPKHAVTRGEIWPKAWQEEKSHEAFDVDQDLQFKVIGKNCEKIQKAIKRTENYLAVLNSIVKRNQHEDEDTGRLDINDKKMVSELQIDLSQDCADFPHLHMDENYNLTVSSTSILKSASIWGIIRGMETFTQLFYLSTDYKKIQMNRTNIVDWPQYSHRGLLVDNSRHFVSVDAILSTLDAMAMNKMNVFHWHIVDDPSFPYQSKRFPELSAKGSYHPSMVYTRSNMERIRDYAKDLGIRILMEIDMPGHSTSWSISHPEIFTKCGNGGPMNPVKDETYNLIRDLIAEVQEIFPDNYIHFGGDEVNKNCWLDDPEIRKYMKEHNVTNVNQLFALFFKKVIALPRKGTIPVFWEEAFNNGAMPTKKAVVNTWFNKGTMEKVLKAGYYGIHSRGNYLDHINDNFDKFYRTDPRLQVKNAVNNETLLLNLLGSTACMWGEMMDETNLLSRVWPRASAIAEVLWSVTTGNGPDEHTYSRIEEQTCRMRRRGVPAQPPDGPGFCVL